MRLLHDRIGLRVIVQLLDGDNSEGVIVARKRWPRGRRYRVVTIRLDDGRLLRGFECWWGAAVPDPVGRWSLPPSLRAKLKGVSS